MLTTLLLAFLPLAPQAPLQVELTPKGKEPVTAIWAASPVAIDTDFGSATVKAAHLAQIQFGPPDVVTTDAGAELRGELKVRSFDVKVDGKPRHFNAGELASLMVMREGKAVGVPSFGGEWMTTFGPAKFEQHGAAVKGSFGFDGQGEIDGKIKDGALQFTYRDSGGSGSGHFELLAADNAFTGGIGKGNDENFWGGYRKAPAAAPIKPGETTGGQTQAGMRYWLRVPKAHGGDKKWPALCILHGSNMDSRAYVDTIVGTWPELAEQFVIVGLDGERLSPASKASALRFNYTYINFGGPKAGPAFAHRQSPALVAESLQQLGKELPVAKWFLGGHSQGGFLTYCLVMYYPELLAGAFPMSCNLLVQCEPDEFRREQSEQQHRVAVAVIHGRKDDVVDYSGGAYCHLRMLDGGFPSVRLFAPDNVGHQFAWLPVADALHWLVQITADDPSELLSFAEKRLQGSTAQTSDCWRDIGAVLQRLAKEKPDAALAGRVASLQKKLADAIAKDKDGAWVDEFLAFRAQYATAAAAAPVLDAYDELRRRQSKDGDRLFGEWRQAKGKDRDEVVQKILKTCYATKWYEAVKLWSK
jgi:predicted esterase